MKAFFCLFLLGFSLTVCSADKPNVIYILTDDLGYGDLSCYGQKKFKTPHIDRLASEGLKFTAHYSGNTVCTPSRAVLMTGKVKTPEEKVLATKLAWEIKGVREVVNEVQVTDTSSLKDVAKDLAASAQLRGKLITDGNISSLNFSIDVVNGIVYLSGVAASTDEMNAVIAHAQDLRFAQQVVNYISLATDKRD